MSRVNQPDRIRILKRLRAQSAPREQRKPDQERTGAEVEIKSATCFGLRVTLNW